MHPDLVKKVHEIASDEELREAEILMRVIFRRYKMLVTEYIFEKVDSVFLSEKDHFNGDVK